VADGFDKRIESRLNIDVGLGTAEKENRKVMGVNQAWLPGLKERNVELFGQLLTAIRRNYLTEQSSTLGGARGISYAFLFHIALVAQQNNVDIRLGVGLNIRNPLADVYDQW